MASISINSSIGSLLETRETPHHGRLGSRSTGLSWRKMVDNSAGIKSLACSKDLGRMRNARVEPMVFADRSSASTTEDPTVCADTGTGSGMDCEEADADIKELNSEGQGLGILQFLRGKKLLITGATGFLAKVLIEKILRTAPDLGKMYLLIKAKDKQAAMDRVNTEILNTELFRCLRETHAANYKGFMQSRLVPVVGDVRELNLGIQAGLTDEIAENVDIIINSAANTTFDERYDVSLDINTIGPCRLMSLAKRCKKLKLFVQVSTAYVNGKRQGKILERPFSLGESIAREIATFRSLTTFPPELDVEAETKLAIDSTSIRPDSTLSLRMKDMGLQRARMHGWQDTYVFTKAMGEMLLDSMRGDIPVINVRPSVIESTCREPFPGWMEGNRMMDPIILYYGKGQLNGFLTDPKGVLDVVPADVVVNAVLASIAKHGKDEKPGMYVYHIASSVTNPLVFQDLADFLYEHFKISPFLDSNGIPIHVPRMKLFHNMNEFSSYILEDAIEKIQAMTASSTSSEKLSAKMKNICMKSVEQAKYLANLYEPYTFYAGRFDNTNTKKLMQEMTSEERRMFDFDVGSIDWKDYISNVHIPGLRRHVMKGRGMQILAPAL